MGSIPVRAWIFSGLLFPQLLKLSTYCDDLHLLKMYFPQYKYMRFIYSYHSSSTVTLFFLVQLLTWSVHLKKWFAVKFIVWPGHVRVGGIVVSIAAFQAVDPGSIPGRRIFCCTMISPQQKNSYSLYFGYYQRRIDIYFQFVYFGWRSGNWSVSIFSNSISYQKICFPFFLESIFSRLHFSYSIKNHLKPEWFCSSM